MSKIAFICETYDACTWYRAHVPGVELRNRGHEVSLVVKRDWGICGAADILVFQKLFSHQSIEDLIRYKAEGKRIVYDIDDDVWHINPANPAYEFWSKDWPQKNVSIALQAADVVTVTTPRLAQVVSRFNANVRVIPNCLPDEHWNIKRARDDVLTIGWAGSGTHWDDLRQISGVVEMILEDYPNVVLALAGMKEYPFPEHPRILKIKPVKLEDYANLVALFDIGLAPLTDTLFNACKSDLKYLEYAAVGIPVIASKVPSYEASIEQGKNGLLARNQKDWLKHLRRLIADENFRDEIGAAAREFAESRFMSRNVGLWEEALGLDTSTPKSSPSKTPV